MPNNLLDDFSKLNSQNAAFEALKKYTNDGIDLIWTGRPVQGFRLRKEDWILIPFSLLWGGFAIVWEFLVIVMDAGLIFQLWGIPFVLVGLYLIIGRFFHDAWYRKRTFYGLTKEQLLIKRPNKLETLDISDLHKMDVEEGKNGRGSLIFKLRQSSKKKNFSAVPAMGYTLDNIKNTAELYQIIRNLKKATRKQPSL